MRFIDILFRKKVEVGPDIFVPTLINFLGAYTADWDYLFAHPLDAIRSGLAHESLDTIRIYRSEIDTLVSRRDFLEKELNFVFESDAEFDRFIKNLRKEVEARLNPPPP